jgi:hypothetical protein
MALAIDLAGVGMPTEQASLLGQGVLTAVTAAGTTAGTATALNSSQTAWTSAAGATGAILPSTAALTRLFFIRNLAASTAALNVYPPTGGTINGGAANAPMVIAAGQSAILMCQVQGASSVWVAYSTSTSGQGVPAAPGQTASARTIAVGDLVPAASTDFTDSTPSATVVNIGEVLVPNNVTVTGVANFSGSVASGNLKVGLADSTGAIVATSASTAMVGTDSYQRIPFTGTVALLPGTYYILTFYDNGTARYNSPPLGSFGAAQQTGQVYATGFTTITAPSTFVTNVAPIASLY